MNFVNRDVGVVDSEVAGDFGLSRPSPVARWPITYRSVEFIAIGMDLAIILVASIVSGVLYHLTSLGVPGDVVKYLGSGAVVAALFVSLMKSRELYEPAKLAHLRQQMRSITLLWGSVFLFLAGVVFALKIGDDFSRGAILLFAGSGFGGLLAERMVLRHLMAVGLAKRKFSGRSIVVVSHDSAGGEEALIDNLAQHGLQVRQQFVLPPQQPDSRPREAVIAQIMGCLHGSDVHEIIVSGELNDWPNLRDLLSELRKFPIPVTLVPAGASSELLKRPSHVIGGAVCVELQRGPLSSFERTLKRLFDVVCATLGLIVFGPLMAATAIAIKLESRGPALFQQRRSGFNGRPFRILKFRTMLVLEDGECIRQAASCDDRVTPMGKWLRRTSIDELPQLFNVLSGSMSLVGPRPHALAHNDRFAKLLSNYAFRHHVKPGLTGWAQVNGYRGPTPNLFDIQNRVEHDLWYINNWSFTLDCRIVVRTLFELMRGRNAY